MSPRANSSTVSRSNRRHRRPPRCRSMDGRRPSRLAFLTAPVVLKWSLSATSGVVMSARSSFAAPPAGGDGGGSGGASVLCGGALDARRRGSRARRPAGLPIGGSGMAGAQSVASSAPSCSRRSATYSASADMVSRSSVAAACSAGAAAAAANASRMRAMARMSSRSLSTSSCRSTTHRRWALGSRQSTPPTRSCDRPSRANRRNSTALPSRTSSRSSQATAFPPSADQASSSTSCSGVTRSRYTLSSSSARARARQTNSTSRTQPSSCSRPVVMRLTAASGDSQSAMAASSQVLMVAACRATSGTSDARAAHAAKSWSTARMVASAEFTLVRRSYDTRARCPGGHVPWLDEWTQWTHAKRLETGPRCVDRGAGSAVEPRECLRSETAAWDGRSEAHRLLMGHRRNIQPIALDRPAFPPASARLLHLLSHRLFPA
jgi:hypothetical protein